MFVMQTFHVSFTYTLSEGGPYMFSCRVKPGKTVCDCLVLAVVCIMAVTGSSAQGQNVDIPLMWGGCGGVYFYAPEGELWVEVFKQDLNISNSRTNLRAVLFAPDRSVLDEQTIAEDGFGKGNGPGPVGSVRLRTTVTQPGVYGLNVTVSEDRYGDNMSWGIRTNCPHYLVETSRGHRDARHMEPLVFRIPRDAVDVNFAPRNAAFAIECRGCANTAGKLTVYDSGGGVIAELPVDDNGVAKTDLPASADRPNAPWRLHIPGGLGTVQIDGVTRWDQGEPWENLSLWTPDAGSWFDFHDFRWLLTPYNLSVYTGSHPSRKIEFTVHNNSPSRERVILDLSFGEGGAWPVRLSQNEIVVGPEGSVPVTLTYDIPPRGNEWTCFLRASVGGSERFSTWSSVTLRRGEAPAESPVAVPVKLEPYRHENAQFGYLPDYPLDNQVYFDLDNVPFIVTGNGIFTLRGDSWLKTTEAVRGDNGAVIRIRPIGTRIAFGGDNGVYCLGRSSGGPVLLHSRDHGATYTAWPLPGNGVFDIEPFSGHNLSDSPPAIVRFIQTAADPNHMWRRINDFDLILPVKKPNGSITFEEPIPISKMSIGLSIHSGIPSVVVSRGDMVHVTWGEATEPAEKVPGVPTYVASWNRRTRRLSEPALVGYGPPANDIHNTPCITIDSKAYLHVLVGTHGATFKYVCSLKPDTAGSGWTEPVDVGEGLRQTYVGMVCDRNDTLHLVFRLWLNDNAYFPAGYYANLAYMNKPAGKPWSAARPLIVAPFSEYSIFYHRLAIDRMGQLFLSYDYWSTFWFYRTDHRGTRRSLIMSPDGGSTWRLAPSNTFTAR